jgi:putative membrane protein
MDYVVSMFVNRPYVVSLVLVFIVIAAAERGWLRMVIWLVTAASIGWLSEFSSQRTGFPYGFYSYYPSSFANELWLSNVPLFASLSYAALSYLGYSLTYTLFSPLRKGSHGIERVENEKLLLSSKVALCASLLITWSDFVIDPITHLGEYWFLGKIYQYVPGDYGWLTFIYQHMTSGWHFDVPLSNYVGWLITFFAIVYVNQLIDKALLSWNIAPKPAFNLPHRCLWSLAYYIGNFMFMLSVNVYLYFNPAVPAEKQVGLILVNTVVFILAFVVFNVVVIRRKLRANG